MVLIADDIIETVQERINDTQKERTSELRSYLKEVALELTTKFINGVVTREESDISISNNEFLLPESVGKVIGVYNNLDEFEIVDERNFKIRQVNADTRPTVKIVEDRNRWKGVMLDNTSSVTKIDVVYQVRTDDITIIPDEYRELVHLGVESKFHLRRSDLATYREYQRRYEELMDDLSENLMRNAGHENRFKSQLEIDINRFPRTFLRNNELF